MGFIYSDLMVPPLVAINAKYYGWRVALYIAGIMYLSIVATALILDALFSLLGIVPESGRRVSDVVQFGIDYTFWLNLVFIAVAAGLVWLWRRRTARRGAMQHKMEGDGPAKTVAAYVAAAIVLGGLGALAFVGGCLAGRNPQLLFGLDETDRAPGRTSDVCRSLQTVVGAQLQAPDAVLHLIAGQIDDIALLAQPLTHGGNCLRLVFDDQNLDRLLPTKDVQ